MKKLLLMIACAALVSWDHRPVITYHYKGFGRTDQYSQDSCNKYNLGDTLR
jgi:hypothetical protein